MKLIIAWIDDESYVAHNVEENRMIQQANDDSPLNFVWLSFSMGEIFIEAQPGKELLILSTI